MERDRITALAFAIVIISFVLSTVVSLFSLREMALKNMEKLGMELADRIYDTISIELGEPTVVSQTMAHNSFLINLLKDDSLPGDEIASSMQDYLHGIHSGLNYETAFVISEKTRIYYTQSGILKTIQPDHNPRDAWYTSFVDHGRAYELDVDNDEIHHDAWTVFVNARIDDADGTFLGVCGVGMHMTRSQELFYGLESQYRVKIDLVNREGLVQVDTDENRIMHEELTGIDFSASGDYVYQQLSGNRFMISRYMPELDWYLVVRSDGNLDTAQMWNTVLINLLLCVLVLLLMILAVRIIVLRTSALAHASFRDHPTSLLNRRAFEEEKDKLGHSSLPEDFVFVTVDVNGLKTVNDTMGHVAGDELIRGAAENLKKYLGPYGKIYRIGGDEFAAFLTLSGERLEQVLEEMENGISAWSGEKVQSLSVSVGYARSREFPSESILELGRIADERMYAAKEEHYRKTGKDRRRT